MVHAASRRVIHGRGGGSRDSSWATRFQNRAEWFMWRTWASSWIEQIPHHFGPLEHQAAVETDRAARGAAAPARALPTNRQPPIRQLHFLRTGFQQRRQRCGGPRDQPAAQDVLDRLGVLDVAREAEQAGRHHFQARPPRSACDMNPPRLAGAARTRASRAEGLRRRRVLASFGALASRSRGDDAR